MKPPWVVWAASVVEMVGTKSGGAVCVCAHILGSHPADSWRRDLPLELLSGKGPTTLEILENESTDTTWLSEMADVEDWASWDEEFALTTSASPIHNAGNPEVPGRLREGEWRFAEWLKSLKSWLSCQNCEKGCLSGRVYSWGKWLSRLCFEGWGQLECCSVGFRSQWLPLSCRDAVPLVSGDKISPGAAQWCEGLLRPQYMEWHDNQRLMK